MSLNLLFPVLGIYFSPYSPQMFAHNFTSSPSVSSVKPSVDDFSQAELMFLPVITSPDIPLMLNIYYIANFVAKAALKSLRIKNVLINIIIFLPVAVPYTSYIKMCSLIHFKKRILLNLKKVRFIDILILMIFFSTQRFKD